MSEIKIGTLSVEQENVLVISILNAVSTFYGCDTEFIYIKKGDRDYTHYRYVSIYLIVKNTSKLTHGDVSKIFLKEHASVSHAIKKINGYLSYDKKLQNDIKILQSKIDLIKNEMNNNSAVLINENEYIINLNSFHSLKFYGTSKVLLVVNFTEQELKFMQQTFKNTTLKKHNNTGLQYIENNNNMISNGN